MSRCIVLCTFALSSCSLLFGQPDSDSVTAGEDDLEFMLAIDGDPDTQGYELYVARTIDDESFIEHYTPTATPTLLEGRFVLPLRPTAMIRSRSNFPSALIMATGDSDSDGTRETEYIDRLDWTNVAAGISEATFASTIPHELGPALPGLHSRVRVDQIIPDNSQLYTTGRDVTLVDALNGWDAIKIDPEPLLSFDEPIRCVESHGLGLNESELAFFAGSTLALVDANTQGDGQTLHDVQQRVQELPFEVKACARFSQQTTYLVTDGGNLHAIRLEPDGSVVASLALPGDSPSHDRIIDMDFFNFSNNGDPELVLITADPPMIYLGIDTRLSSGEIEFSAPMVAQPLDWTPTAAVKLNNGVDNTDRLYISEAKAAPRCFELGTNSTMLAPELIPCTP